MNFIHALFNVLAYFDNRTSAIHRNVIVLMSMKHQWIMYTTNSISELTKFTKMVIKTTTCNVQKRAEICNLLA